MDFLESFTWAARNGGYAIVEKVPDTLRLPGVRAFDPATNKKAIGYQYPAKSRAATPMIVPAVPVLADQDLPSLRRKALLEELYATAAIYRPLDRQHSNLFREFANTPITDDGILGFANRFGLLGAERTAVSHEIWGDPAHEYEEEPVSLWHREIDYMRSTIKQWRGLKTKNEKAVKAFTDAINVELQDRVSQRVTWNPRNGWFQTGPLPVNLIGALWLQFAFAVARRTKYRDCKQCGKEIEIAAGRDFGRRADAKFCSDACKLKDYRARVEKAKQMARKGLQVRKIATTVDREVGTVRSWIDKKTRT